MRKFAAAIFALIICVPASAQTVSSPPVPYITGTFTPTFTFATPGDLSVVYSAQSGRYTITGNQICVNEDVAFTPTYTTSAGTGLFSLPFAAGSFGLLTVNQITNPTPWPVGVTAIFVGFGATATAQISGHGSAVGAIGFNTTNYVTGTPYWFRISGCYFLP